MLTAAGVSAQVTVPEPEFVNSYYILTSDSTMESIHKENGWIGEHETKSKGLLKKSPKSPAWPARQASWAQ